MQDNKKKELVVFDVDGTLISGQSQRLFLSFLFMRHYIGLFYLVRIWLWFVLYEVGLLRKPQKVMEYAFSFVKGKTRDDIDVIVEDFFQSMLKSKIYSEVVAIINRHRNSGGEVILLSNAAEPIIRRLARYLNIKIFYSTRLEEIGGRFTGKISGKIMYGPQKLIIVEYLTKTLGYSKENICVYTDHDSDIPLISFAGRSFVVNPSKKLRKYAIRNRFPILEFHL